MRFRYYVLNYNHNENKVELFNIFNNYSVQEWTEKEIKKYLRNQSKYKYKNYGMGTEIELYGFPALCEQIKRIISWQERGRFEYEIGVTNKFCKDLNDIQEFDCYEQCEPNIEIITRECIYQYKKQLKEKSNNESL